MSCGRAVNCGRRHLWFRPPLVVVHSSRTKGRYRVRDALWSTPIPLVVNKSDPLRAAALDKLPTHDKEKRRIELNDAPSEDAFGVLVSGGIIDVNNFLRLKSQECHALVHGAP